MTTNKTEVGVFARNASGASEVVFLHVQASPDDIRNGHHYERALDLAADQGYEPLGAFDRSDPAWKVFGDRQKYQAFFDDAVECLQGAWVDGRSCSGADTIDEVTQLFARHQDGQHAYIACSADGYWTHDGWMSDAENAFVTRDSAGLAKLACAGALTVLAVPMADFDKVQHLPETSELEDAADAAMERARQHGFTVGGENAGEVLAEELGLAGHALAAWVAPFLQAYMLHAQEQAETNASSERDSQRGA
ncbi:hypothetical protein [Ramlibacter sp. AN1133]|uniref:hypothetical protein n=1 Tax=Ramlibacter sp. AN1133 TaxID=3133429 RepID=UPI0030C46729